uniref:Uncharacterized protein n=1 Tax=Tanacetum cinerariifolium TaxID=118510 RepID=A0A699JUD9_TANCI|nr:hypothetical protein [Tanacetum cinerariifolium]
MVCEPYGRIVDAFIANKRSKVGKRFGFVRFVGVKNDELFAGFLATIWIGSFHMYASVARFQRQEKAEEKLKKETVKVAARVKEKQVGKVTSDFPHSYHSYVFLLNGCVGRKEKGNNMDMKTITLTDHEEEGFNSVKIHHIGGLWLWVQFEILDSCNAFKNNTMLKSLFMAIKPVSRNFCVDERMVWVETSGLPLCAWGSNAFKKVAVFVGKFMFFEDDKSEAMCMGRVCHTPKRGLDGIRVLRHDVVAYIAQDQENDLYMDF